MEGIGLDKSGTIWVSMDKGADSLKSGAPPVLVKEISPSGVVLKSLKVSTSPRRMALDGSGSVRLTDLFNGKVLKLSPNGSLRETYPVPNALGIAIDSKGNVWVTDYDLSDKGHGKLFRISAVASPPKR